MPIKPENRARYPAHWKEIVAQVRERSGNRCEGSPDYPDCRATNGEPNPDTGSRVVLTTAHLDHVPENCALENLRHWCQRCHLNYDRHHHAQTAYATRKAAANTHELAFDTPGVRDTSDSERLDWLMHNISGTELRRMGITTSAGMTRELLDSKIDALGVTGDSDGR